MAQDAEQKSVQGIQDPAARKAAYYRLQREDAEKGAAKGDRTAAGTAANVYGKLGNAKKNQYYASEHYFGKGVADVGSAIDRAGEAFSKAIPFVAPEARGVGAAKSLIPKALEGVGSSIASRVRGPLEDAANSARQFLGRAKPVAKKLEGGPRKVTGSAQKALTSAPKALKGQVSGHAKALTGGTQNQKALPSAASKLGKDSSEFWGKRENKSINAKELYPERRVRPRGKRQSADEALEKLQKAKATKGSPMSKAEKDIADQTTSHQNRKAAQQGPPSRPLRAKEVPDKVHAPKMGPKNDKGRIRGDRDSRKKSKAGG